VTGERPAWLRFAEKVQAIAQTGLAYASDPYDRERYQELRGIAVEMVARGSGVPVAEVQVAFASGIGYPTPKVDVRAVVFRGDELLLVRERRSGGYTFPGGWADVGDTPGAAAERPLSRLAADKIFPKVARNDPCPCGSGKKFKKCCLNASADRTVGVEDEGARSALSWR